ncbi:MAG: hypothetical protein HYW07_07965 [Candidatus Latescibacteria bacterium]|nr:hypothetical protein [Candidatus Latescibacterota bacterium]
MPRIVNILPLCLALAALLPANPASAQLNSRTAVQRDFLNYGQYNPYRNYAFEPFAPFPVFGWDAPSYDRLGRYLMQGRVMLSADEDRPGLSRMQGLRFETGNVYAVGLDFNYTVLQDSYQGRSYAMMVMLGSDQVETAPIKTRFSPLTLNMTRYTGVRFDVNGPKNKASFIYSRGAGDRDRFSIFTTGQDERSPVILWGTHWETQIGSVLRLGSTFVNQHITDASSSKGSIFRGNLSNGMRPPDLIAVRVVDDSPHETSIPAAAYAVDVVVRGRDEAGNEKAITNAQELATGEVEWVASMDPGRPSGRAVGDHWEASGEGEMIEFTFAMPAGFQSSQAQFIAQVGGDYRIQVRQQHTHEFTRTVAGRTTVQTKAMQWPGLPRSNPAESAGFEGDGGDLKYPLDFKFPETQPAYTVVRSAGASGSLAAREVRFDYGFPTAQTLASLELQMDYAGLKVNGEFALNVQNFKFPFEEGRRNSKEVRAYYLTAQRRLPLLGARAPRLGFEVYRLPADFSGNYDSRRGGAIFHTDVPVAPPNTALTQEFNLFDDNDDGDQWPDDMPDDTPLAGQNDAGVFPGLDENKDNVPDTDQNANGVPDWDEPFLFFWSDPPAFIYDIDMNNNGLPDQTENDDAPDYPYSRDQRGYHGLLDLSGPRFDKLSLGFYRSEQLAGGGESRVGYLRWGTHYQPKPWGQFALLGDLKRVEDSIADPVYVWKNATDPRVNSMVIQEREGQYKLLDLKDPDPDLMLMRNSTAGTFYLAADLQAAENLSLRCRYKWNLNRQNEDEFADGTAQEDRTLSRLTLSHRIEYRRPLRKALTFTARARHLYWRDAGYAPELRQHWSTYGLLFEEEFKLTERTALVAGQEGVPGLLPVYHNEHNARENNFRRWTDVLMLRTQSTYLGWSTVTEMGFEYQRKERKTSEVSNRTFFAEMVFGF